MGRPREQPDREQRIDDEVIVDAYDSTERAMSWYYYLEAKLGFPFAASCIARRQSSPLKVGERVKVVGIASEDECMLEVPAPAPAPAQRPRPDGGNDRHRSNVTTRRTPEQCPRSWNECFEIFDL